MRIVLGLLVAASTVVARDARACTQIRGCQRFVVPADGQLPSGGSVFLDCHAVERDEVIPSVTRLDTGSAVAVEVRAWGDDVLELSLEALPVGTQVHLEIDGAFGQRVAADITIGKPDDIPPTLSGSAAAQVESVEFCEGSVDLLQVDMSGVVATESIAAWGLVRLEPNSRELVSATLEPSQVLSASEDIECFQLIGADFAGHRVGLPRTCVEGCSCSTTEGTNGALAVVGLGLLLLRARRLR